MPEADFQLQDRVSYTRWGRNYQGWIRAIIRHADNNFAYVVQREGEPPAMLDRDLFRKADLTLVRQFEGERLAA